MEHNIIIKTTAQYTENLSLSFSFHPLRKKTFLKNKCRGSPLLMAFYIITTSKNHN